VAPYGKPRVLTGELTVEVTLRRPSGKEGKEWSPVAHLSAITGQLVEEIDWDRVRLKHPVDVEKVYGLEAAQAAVKNVRNCVLNRPFFLKQSTILLFTLCFLWGTVEGVLFEHGAGANVD
jgi:hypothetical protein